MKTQPKTIVINIPSFSLPGRAPTKANFKASTKRAKSWLSRKLSEASKALEN